VKFPNLKLIHPVPYFCNNGHHQVKLENFIFEKDRNLKQ